MRDVQAISFLLAIAFAVPGFLLRLRESTRLLWRLLCYVALGVMLATAASQEHGAWRWIDFAASVVWWLSANGCWQRMEKARKDEARAARIRQALRNYR